MSNSKYYVGTKSEGQSFYGGLIAVFSNIHDAVKLMNKLRTQIFKTQRFYYPEAAIIFIYKTKNHKKIRGTFPFAVHDCIVEKRVDKIHHKEIDRLFLINNIPFLTTREK